LVKNGCFLAFRAEKVSSASILFCLFLVFPNLPGSGKVFEELFRADVCKIKDYFHI